MAVPIVGKGSDNGELFTTASEQALLQPEVLRKHVALVHSYTPLNLAQRKLLNVLLFHAIENMGASNNWWFEITIPKMRELLRYTGHNWEWLRDSVRSLMGAAIEFDLLEDTPRGLRDVGGSRGNAERRTSGMKRSAREVAAAGDLDEQIAWERSVLFPTIRVMASGILKYQVNPELAPSLFKPDVYAILDMTLQSQFTTKYGHALYETVARFRGTGSTGYISIETWRKLLGVGDNRYPGFKDLKRYVIKPAIEDVNERTDYRLRAELRKEGRTVSQMRVLIERQKKLEPALTDGQMRLRDAIAHKGVTVQHAAKLVATLPEGAIRSALEELNHRMSRGDDIRNPGGWLVSRARTLAMSTRDDRRRLEVDRERSGTDLQRGLPSVDELLSVVDSDERERLWAIVVSDLTSIERGFLTKTGREHPVVRCRLRDYLVDQGYLQPGDT